jgi:hypothetical protein
MLIVVHLAAVVLPAARDCVLLPGMTWFYAGWASFMEDRSERWYGQPRPWLT